MKGRGQFPTTRWSVVLTAAKEGDLPRRALHELCGDYWLPLFAYLRRTGMSASDAEDTVQGFLSTLLESPAIEGVDPDRGRFRSYLLGALRNYLGRLRARAQAAKRGGGQAVVSLSDAPTAERELQIPDDRTPEGAYAYAWAMSLLRRTEQRVADEYAGKGKGALFEVLRPTLLSDEPPPYRVLGDQIGLSEGAARVAAHRIRTRFRALLREEVAQTVSSAAEIDDELRAVIAAVAE
ncbi:MAG: sigma-70 family RNA polymerase sigma factor [Myxococcota bacterium]